MKLRLENISKSYGERAVLKHVNLLVNQGEIVGLLGANGAGKTTLFYILTGLEYPQEGYVWFGEQDITLWPLHRRAHLGLSYLPQEPSIFRNLSVRDNIRLILEQTGVPAHLRRSRLDGLIQDFHLEKIATTLGVQVSGGERRRTEIARALAAGETGPKFLLLDEPFAGVDPITVADIQNTVNDLRRERALGILITDHNVRETLAITDRAYILQDGEILASGTAEELYDNPFVRQYYLGQNFQR